MRDTCSIMCKILTGWKSFAALTEGGPQERSEWLNVGQNGRFGPWIGTVIETTEDDRNDFSQRSYRYETSRYQTGQLMIRKTKQFLVGISPISQKYLNNTLQNNTVSATSLVRI